MAKISSEFANKITTNVEKDIKDIQQTKSLELDIDMVNKAKNNENSDNEYSNDSIHSDDEVSFFNDARLF
jgi:cupin superfamily acireductone dioxygenase involved in methionine salvage